MHRIYTKRAVQAVGVAVALGWAIANPTAQSNLPPERFTAIAISLGGINTRAGSGQVLIDVKRWSSTAEQEKLISALLKEGPEALLEALRDMQSVGTIRTPDSLGYDLRFAHQEPAEDGGRRIIIGTDRPISFWEAVNRPRSVDYPFTVIEIHMPKDGPGQGKASIATRITAHGKTISLEDFATTPVQLNEVTSVTRPRPSPR
jgi:hypothetical protein